MVICDEVVEEARAYSERGGNGKGGCGLGGWVGEGKLVVCDELRRKEMGRGGKRWIEMGRREQVAQLAIRWKDGKGKGLRWERGESMECWVG